MNRCGTHRETTRSTPSAEWRCQPRNRCETMAMPATLRNMRHPLHFKPVEPVMHAFTTLPTFTLGSVGLEIRRLPAMGEQCSQRPSGNATHTLYPTLCCRRFPPSILSSPDLTIAGIEKVRCSQTAPVANGVPHRKSWWRWSGTVRAASYRTTAFRRLHEAALGWTGPTKQRGLTETQ